MKIEIDVERYVELLVIEESMARLDSGGVDNWDWYWESLNPDDEPDMEEFEDALRIKYGLEELNDGIE